MQAPKLAPGNVVGGNTVKLSNLDDAALNIILSHVGLTRYIRGVRTLPRNLLSIANVCTVLRKAVKRYLLDDLCKLEDPELEWVLLAGKDLRTLDLTGRHVSGQFVRSDKQREKSSRLLKAVSQTCPLLKELHLHQILRNFAHGDLERILRTARDSLECLSIPVTEEVTRVSVAGLRSLVSL